MLSRFGTSSHARIQDAARARASIDERHLARARLARSPEGTVQLRLEPLDAPTLASLLARGPVAPRSAVAMVAQLAKAVDALEREGLVARDLAPDCVVLNRERGAVLMDYGIRPELMPLERSEADPHFAFRAPEETPDGPLSPRAAVYSLGALLLAALSGDPAPGRIHLRDEEGSRDLPPTLRSVVARAMAEDPEARYADAIELARAAVDVLRTNERLARAQAAQAPKPPKPDRVLAWKEGREAAKAAERERKAKEAAEREAAKAAERERKAKVAAARESAKAAEAERKAAEDAHAAADKAAKAAQGAELTAAKEAQAAAQRAAKAQQAAERKAAQEAQAAEREAAKAAEAERKAAQAAERKAAQEARAAERKAAKEAQAAERAAAAAARAERKRADAAARDQARAHKRASRSTGKARRPAPARPTLKPPVRKRRGTSHAAATPPRAPKRNAAAGAGARTIRREIQRRRVALSIAGVCVVAAGVIAAALFDGTAPASATTISNGQLTLRLPQGWERTTSDEARFGPLSGSLAARSGGTSLLAAAMVEPTETVRAIRRLAPAGTAPVAARLGKLEVTRYDGIRTRAGATASAYVLNTTGQSVLLVCQATTDPAGASLRHCADAGSAIQLSGEQPMSLAAAGARGPAAYRALTALHSEFLADRARIAKAALAAGQADAARDLEVAYYEASRRIQATGLPGRSVATFVTDLFDTGEAYGALATAIDDGSRAAYDAARADVVSREKEIWATGPDSAVTSITNQR